MFDVPDQVQALSGIGRKVGEALKPSRWDLGRDVWG